MATRLSSPDSLYPEDIARSLLLLTGAAEPTVDVLPALALLPDRVHIAPPVLESVLDGPLVDAVLVDARRDLVAARGLLRLLRAAGLQPVLAIVTEGGWPAVRADWGAADVLLATAGPAEVDARLRLAAERLAEQAPRLVPDPLQTDSVLVVDGDSYTARLGGRPMHLAYKEFELLKFLVAHPGRVFTRAQLLEEVWGDDYYGGTRTVDVHVRRLRAKLGPEHDAMIGTVRNVGYRFVPSRMPARDRGESAGRSGRPAEAGAIADPLSDERAGLYA